MTPPARPVPGERLSVAPPSQPGATAEAEPAPSTPGPALPSSAPGSEAPAQGASPDPEASLGSKLNDTLRRKRPLSLRARLVGMLLVLLICGFAVIGGVTHASMSARLNAQVNDELRAATQKGANQIVAASHQDSPQQQTFPNNQGDASNVPSAGTIVGAIADGSYFAEPSYRDPASTASAYTELNAADQAVLLDFASKATSASEPANLSLSIGKYRAQAVRAKIPVRDANWQLGYLEVQMVVAVPTTEATRTLATLDLSMVLVSLGGIVIIGTLGTVLVSRALRPLARVSAVASAVAKQPLEKGEVDVTLRVPAEDAQPGTEVGNVGLALNSLLDNVDGALDVRARSEARMRRFAADASHELRTPLAAIQGYSELIGATEALSDDGDRSLGRVREQTKRMTELVENLLLLARLDEGKPPAEAPVDLTRLAADLSRDFTVAAKDHQWKLQFDADHPVVVTGDEAQLTRVLQNLMSNARKHTSDGTTVTVGVGVAPDGRARLSVTDNGEGIDPEFLDKVFDRFARADAARSGSMPTTGLGLSIVKAIVDSHGGEITVASEPGRTEFAVLMPLAAEDKA